MPFRRRVMLLAGPVVGAATLGAIVAFSVPALAAASPTPSTGSGSGSTPSTTAPAPSSGGGPGANGQQGNCPNM